MDFLQIEPHICKLNLKSALVRAIATIIILMLVGSAIYRSVKIFSADRIIRSEQTVESYSRAILHDPTDAALWWHRGRLQHYSIDRADIPKAIQDYQRALALNKRLPQAWVDLADCYERTGRNSEAEAALENAFSTRAYSPLIRWQAGNFFLRRGNLPRMYECFKLASEYDIEKLIPAIDLSWKADSDHSGILERLVPNTLPANLRYLQFLAGRDELDLARVVWSRIQKNEVPDAFDYRASQVFPYIDRLLAFNRIEEAQSVWNNALLKAGEGLSNSLMAVEAPMNPKLPSNLVWNGSFEKEILQGGFDWRFPDMKEAQFRIDSSDRIEGIKSLKLTFRDANISFAHFSQIIPMLTPGNYQLDYFLRTEGLTTDKTPYWVIQGYPDPAKAFYQTDPFPPSTPWRKASLVFAVKEGCKAVQLILRRDLSSKFDNQIKGSLWLDGISIHAID
jgi:tetratricopeptide (TPR) repeat protein